MPGVFIRRVAAKEVLGHDEARSHPCHPPPGEGTRPTSPAKARSCKPGALTRGPRLRHNENCWPGSWPNVKHRTALENGPSPPHSSVSAGTNLRFDPSHDPSHTRPLGQRVHGLHSGGFEMTGIAGGDSVPVK